MVALEGDSVFEVEVGWAEWDLLSCRLVIEVKRTVVKRLGW